MAHPWNNGGYQYLRRWSFGLYLGECLLVRSRVFAKIEHSRMGHYHEIEHEMFAGFIDTPSCQGYLQNPK
jgi:hypothetical protein